ncbi:hypothetical protein VKT23_018410 [Stygiomarasmius scandens]|uniref:Uncharacterized protein n=1 Tax=Marasmiellus scandens TaxID=2682957 RepID=A0ABR1IP31_9AGAR
MSLPSSEADVDWQGALDTYQKTVIVKVWYEDCHPPLILPTHLKCFPIFTIPECSTLFCSVLQGDKEALIETFDPETLQWQCHDSHTVRIVQSRDTLLYRFLPNGPTGTRFLDCPGLDMEVNQMGHAHSESIHPINNLLSSNSTIQSLQFEQNDSYSSHQDTQQLKRRHLSSTRVRKSWPIGYTVLEIATGMELISQMDSSLSKRAQFNGVFPGVMFKGPTFSRHYTLWKGLDPDLVNCNPNIPWVDLIAHILGTRAGRRAAIQVPPTHTGAHTTQSDVSISFPLFPGVIDFEPIPPSGDLFNTYNSGPIMQ